MYVLDADGETVSGQTITQENAWTVREIASNSSDPIELADIKIGVRMTAPNTILRGCTIHNTKSGVLVSSSASNGKIVDCLFLNDGWRETLGLREFRIVGKTAGGTNIGGGHGPAAYIQSEVGFSVINSIFANAFSLNWQLYGSQSAHVRNLTLEDNIVLNSEMVLGTWGTNCSGIGMSGNLLYMPTPNIGYIGQGDDIVCDSNRIYCVALYSAGAAGIVLQNWRDLTFTNNVVYTEGRAIEYYIGTVETQIIDHNTYYINSPNSGAPFYHSPGGRYLSWSEWRALGFDQNSTLTIGVPPDRVELRACAETTSRYWLIIENWSNASSVSVDFSGLSAGNWSLKNAQNLSETLSIHRGVVNVSMTGWTVSQPASYTNGWKPNTTRRLSVFIVEQVPM